MPLHGLVRDAMHAKVLALHTNAGRRCDVGSNPNGAGGAAAGRGNTSF